MCSHFILIFDTDMRSISTWYFDAPPFRPSCPLCWLACLQEFLSSLFLGLERRRSLKESKKYRKRIFLTGLNETSLGAHFLPTIEQHLLAWVCYLGQQCIFFMEVLVDFTLRSCRIFWWRDFLNIYFWNKLFPPIQGVLSIFLQSALIFLSSSSLTPW